VRALLPALTRCSAALGKVNQDGNVLDLSGTRMTKSDSGTTRPNKGRNQMEKRGLKTQQDFWCPGSDNSPGRHQFTTTKIYGLANDPDNAFAICPQHNVLVPVKIVDKKLPSAEPPAATEAKKGFFEKQLCKRIGKILDEHAYDIEFSLKYKWYEPSRPLSRMFELYTNSKTHERIANVPFNREAGKAPALLERIKQAFGLPCTFMDTSTMTDRLIHDLYALCAHSASTRHLYEGRSGFSIRDYFSIGTLGSTVPVLIVYAKEEIDFVLPHRTSNWATVTIHNFLTTLETALKTDLKDKLAHWVTAEADLKERQG